jgi:outer membrane protein assembly factor BamE (lipoprotein component of BamABCDE complex)
MRNPYKLFVLPIVAIAALFIQGCATAGNDSLRKETEESVAMKITEGQTTREQVKSMFGSPFETSYTDGGLEIWKYELAKMKADAASYIPVVGLFAASSSGMRKELTILFDEEGVVRKFNMSESPVKVRSGLLNQ